ncbi:MAG: hypothetical protein ACI4VK_04765 [Candidatus Coproplasma sp.]
MTKRLKLFLAIILGAIAIACGAAGCSVGEPGREEILANYNGGQVTYYANGGSFNNNTAIIVREIHFKEADVPFFDMTDNSKESYYVLYGGYDFTGWYLPARYESGEHEGEVMYTYTPDGSTETVPAYPKLNDDGTPVTDSNEARPLFYIDGSKEEILEKNIRVVPSDTLVDSSYIIKADDNLIVCATWKPALKFVFKLAVDESFTIDGKTYKQGDEITNMAFGKAETASPGQTTTVNFDGMTFVSNYTDEACTTYATTYNRADYEGQTEIVVWSRFIKGSWTIIKNNANNIKDMFSGLNSSSKAFYLLEDVDCSSITNFGVVQGVRAKVEGNGHTLTNLNFSATSLANGTTLAPVFGAIYASAEIKNLKLSNITISVTGKGDLTLYAVCKSIEEGAVLENLTIENVSATVSIPSTSKINNAQGDDRSNWIFGGLGTDEAFLTAYSGVTLTGTNTLTIK